MLLAVQYYETKYKQLVEHASPICGVLLDPVNVQVHSVVE